MKVTIEENQIKEIVQLGIDTDQDIEINATRKSDGYESIICTVFGNSDSSEEYMKEIKKEIHDLVEFSKWEISEFNYEIV